MTHRRAVQMDALPTVDHLGLTKGAPVTVAGETGKFTFLYARQQLGGTVAVTVYGGRKGHEKGRVFAAERVQAAN